MQSKYTDNNNVYNYLYDMNMKEYLEWIRAGFPAAIEQNRDAHQCQVSVPCVSIAKSFNKSVLNLNVSY